LQQRLQLQEQRLLQIGERLQQTQQTPEPKFDEDPLGALAYKQEQHERVLQQQIAMEQQRMQQTEMQNKMQHFVAQYTNDAQAFAKETPDFMEAYQYLVSNRIAELKSLGYNDAQANQLLQEDEMALAAKAYQDGVNPAERIYNTAKFRGYNKAPTVQVQDNSKKLQEFAKAKESAVSLSNTSAAKSGSSGITMEAIAAMDEDEFNNLTPAQWKKALGG